MLINEKGYDMLVNISLQHKNLKKLPYNLPKTIIGNFYCDNNDLESLDGSPFKIIGSFNVSNNLLPNLIGGPEIVRKNFSCDNNDLLSLVGMPKYIGNDFWCIINSKLLDVSDIWESTINGKVFFDFVPLMAILPLVKFSICCMDRQIGDSLRINKGDGKQNILNLQYDLIENGYSDNAKWKPD